MSSLHPFGPTFKKLREMRTMSIKEAADGIVTPQFLRQFEKGEKNYQQHQPRDSLNRSQYKDCSLRSAMI